MNGTITIRGQEIKYRNNELFFRAVQSGKWEPETFDVLDKFIEPKKCFIDIGAWCGVLSIYAAKLGAYCYAVEPDDDAYYFLSQNIIENKTEFVIRAYHAAITNFDAPVVLTSNGGWGNSESSLVHRANTTKTTTVRGTTLWTLLSHPHQEVCLVKIDCEGSESVFIDDEFRDTLVDIGCPPVVISFHPRWFLSPKEKSVQKIINALYPVYDFESLAMKKKYSSVEFEKAMDSSFDHSFLLTAKK